MSFIKSNSAILNNTFDPNAYLTDVARPFVAVNRKGSWKCIKFVALCVVECLL